MLIRERLDEISAERGAGLDKVASFIRSYTAVITVDFGRAVIRLDDGALSSEARAEVRSYKREIDHRLRGFIQEGIGDGSIAPCDPKLAAFVIGGAINWTCMWYKPGGPQSAEQIAESFVTTFTSGLSGATRHAEREKPLRLLQGRTAKPAR
jgi:hypothetical protein